MTAIDRQAENEVMTGRMVLGRLGFSLPRRVLGLLMLLGAAAGTCSEPAPSGFPPGYRLGPVAFPPPVGPYPVGTLTFELRRADDTPLGVVAWYPAANRKGQRAPYFTAAEKRVTVPALARTFGWPPTMLQDFADVTTHAHLDAPVARGRFPLLVFSHGFMMYPRQNTALMERLAAAGYVVLSVAHPGDAADLPSSRGTLAAHYTEAPPEPDPKAVEAFWTAPDRAAQRKLLPALWRSPRVAAMTDRLAQWRDDLRLATDAVIGPRRLPTLRAITSILRPDRIAYVGMSFGGSTSVSACVRDTRCTAAINLDGIEFDSSLYDRDAGKPVLLIQSDWKTYPNAGPPGLRFTSYDHAYERWATAGQNADIHRYWLKEIRHLGMSDLILAARNPARDAVLGTINGARATEAINALSLAFLDRYVGRRGGSIAAVAARHPELVRHSAAGAPGPEHARSLRKDAPHE